MRTKEEIKQMIEELKNERDNQNFTQSTRTKYNRRIGELEWVLDE